MTQYRTHKCDELKIENKGEIVKLSGWIHSKRDHGNLLFIDLRDHYGITQCVIDVSHSNFDEIEKLRIESVITVEGEVLARSEETINENMPTGKIEVSIKEFEIHSKSEVLPILVAGDKKFPEDLRLKYRFIDLRREKLQKNIMLRSNIIDTARRSMKDQGFLELQTPILTASSPEGARDFLVPSRQHPGKFYALPQAPQQFKQLSMVAGFDKYFQIAPCFRDEDTRADRVLEFYQLDVEMSFVGQEEVFQTMEPVIINMFNNFKGEKVVDENVVRIPYAKSMEDYGIDKPDLRNPLIIKDVTDAFKGSNFSIFANNIEKGAVVKAIPAPKTSDRPRSFFDKLNDWARGEGAKGLGYIVFDENGEAKGPIAKNLDEQRIASIKETCSLENGDSVFFACDKLEVAQKFAGTVRIKLGNDLELIDENIFKFAWIVDFPMYELNEETGEVDFGHNPFSMPQGGKEALEKDNPLDILAYQYDMVCNGFEICSGGVRNFKPEVMFKAFEIAGYPHEEVEKRFGGMLNAFKFGAPPHAGCAFGLERIIMLIAGEPNLREVILFPINQKGQDVMMGAPLEANIQQLRELHVKVNNPPKASNKKDEEK